MVTVQETADIQPKEFSKLSSGELIDMNEAISYDKKDEEVASAKTLYYRDIETVHELKVQRVKCWKPIQT